MSSSPAIPHEACLICGSSRLKPLSGYAAAHLVRCQQCGLAFAGWSPSDAELAAHYRNYGTGWFDSPVTRQRYRELLDTFEPYRQTNRLLDIGCGPGYFLEEAVKRGWEAVGTEFGARALELNRAKGLDVIAAPATTETFAPDSFDVITAFEVVEHVRDPAGEAAVIAHALRRRGLFYFTTPNFNAVSRRILRGRWVNIGYPEHLSYFTRSTLRSWLAPFGFAAVEIPTTGFSPSRLRKSIAPASETAASGQSSDERLRIASERSPALGVAKRAANDLLSALGAGDTLKARFELR
jgi:2-polyprenyl-3-methyl-5-hydroxy-6-metoxy-1,4-benzoquinol methylase